MKAKILILPPEMGDGTSSSALSVDGLNPEGLGQIVSEWAEETEPDGTTASLKVVWMTDDEFKGLKEL